MPPNPSHSKILCLTTEIVSCAFCLMSWKKHHNKSTTSFLLPCPGQCQLCPGCFSNLMAEKGCNFYFFCPCCDDGNSNVKLNSWKVKYPKFTSTNQACQQIHYNEIAEPDRHVYQIQYHHASFLKNADPLANKKAYITLIRRCCYL